MFRSRTHYENLIVAHLLKKKLVFYVVLRFDSDFKTV
jgi:hypothetical protein